jgi:hypothetical protein
VFGAKVANVMFFEEDGSANLHALFAGGSVGYAANLGSLTLMPEVGIAYPVYASRMTAGSVSEAWGEGVVYQLALGVLFNGVASDASSRQHAWPDPYDKRGGSRLRGENGLRP